MAPRTVSGKCSVDSGEAMEIVLVDKYLHEVGGTVQQVSVTDGTFSVALEPSRYGFCYLAKNNQPPRQFWVYEPTDEAVTQEVDLTQPVLPRNKLDTLLEVDDRTLGVNAERVMGVVYCGAPVVSEEEQRMLCRYDDAMDGTDDPDACRIESTLQERYDNG